MSNDKEFEDWFESATGLEKWQPKAAYEAGGKKGERKGIEKTLQIINGLIKSGQLQLSWRN